MKRPLFNYIVPPLQCILHSAKMMSSMFRLQDKNLSPDGSSNICMVPSTFIPAAIVNDYTHIALSRPGIAGSLAKPGFHARGIMKFGRASCTAPELYDVNVLCCPPKSCVLPHSSLVFMPQLTPTVSADTTPYPNTYRSLLDHIPPIRRGTLAKQMMFSRSIRYVQHACSGCRKPTKRV